MLRFRISIGVPFRPRFSSTPVPVPLPVTETGDGPSRPFAALDAFEVTLEMEEAEAALEYPPQWAAAPMASTISLPLSSNRRHAKPSLLPACLPRSSHSLVTAGSSSLQGAERISSLSCLPSDRPPDPTCDPSSSSVARSPDKRCIAYAAPGTAASASYRAKSPDEETDPTLTTSSSPV